MGDTFFSYLQQLELIAFFSAYPLVYAVMFLIKGNQSSQHGLPGKLFALLPFSYALVGTLYIALQLNNLYPDYSFETIKQLIVQQWLIAWGLLSLLFWIPTISQNPIFSLLHSLVFFFIIVKDIFFPFPDFATNKDIVRTDMQLFTDSLILNIGAFTVVILVYFIARRFKFRQGANKTV